MKRVFVDPQLLTKQWFQDFGTSEKMAFITILLLCDDVGVWHINTKLVEFLVGSTVDWKRLEKCNGNIVLLREGVLWIPDYCRFQYKHIEASNNAHESYRKMAENHGILETIRSTYKVSSVRLLLANPTSTLDQPLTKGTPRVKEKEKEKDSYISSLPEEREDNSGELGEEPGPSKPLPEKIRYDFEESLWYGITDEQVALWGEAYPAVDVDLELRQMGEWCKAAGAKGRKNNWRAFITNWLKRQQDKGGSVQPGQQKGGYRR